ncbi:hypothetical protein I350_04036 [Cryptococcus amylolentus CBS 6273]|uniref:Uncharacterized protein n=1 Tax=Cryptococcus amylolentus CBS 6273 TaxID=1296118 RepID=A0A1E3K0K6_9TREE|nr:hypothetical protein I350_04036 [Cryptococcus amylolentus CBS 6273]
MSPAMHAKPHDVITTLAPLNPDIQSHIWRFLTSSPSCSFLCTSRAVYAQSIANLYCHVVLDKWNAMRFFKGLGLSEDEAAPLSTAEQAGLLCRCTSSIPGAGGGRTPAMSMCAPTTPHRSPFVHKIMLLRHCQSLHLVDVQAAVWTLRASTKFDRLDLYSYGHHRLFPNLTSIHFGQSLIHYANEEPREAVVFPPRVDWSECATGKNEHLIPGTHMSALQVLNGLAKEFSGKLSVDCDCEGCMVAKEKPDGRKLEFDLPEDEPLSCAVLAFMMAISQKCSTVKIHNVDPIDLQLNTVGRRNQNIWVVGVAAEKVMLYLKPEAWMYNTHEESVFQFIREEFSITRDDPTVPFAERYFGERRFLSTTPESIEIISNSLHNMDSLANNIIQGLPHGHLIVDSGIFSARVPHPFERQHQEVCDDSG